MVDTLDNSFAELDVVLDVVLPARLSVVLACAGSKVVGVAILWFAPLGATRAEVTSTRTVSNGTGTTGMWTSSGRFILDPNMVSCVHHVNPDVCSRN